MQRQAATLKSMTANLSLLVTHISQAKQQNYERLDEAVQKCHTGEIIIYCP